MENLKYWLRDLQQSWQAIHPLAWLLIITGLAFALPASIALLRVQLADGPLPAYEAGQETAGISERQLFRLARQFEQHEDFSAALQLYNQLENRGSDAFRERVKYNMGYIYLQQAAALWNTQGVWAYAELNTLVNLAKDYYRQVLRMNPDNWDARYNYEFALRITPPPKEVEKADWTGRRSSVHAILPGIPGGGP